jgi:hypothetical protein
MSEERTETSLAEAQPSDATHNRGILRWFIIPLALFLLYVLSVGPVLRLMPTHAVLNFYGPLIILEEHCRPLDRFVVWYVEDVWKCGKW